MTLVKLPGMVDVHTHLRDPGATHKEDFYTGTAAALAGGVTMVLDMPNNPIPTVSLKALLQKAKIASSKAVCDYGLIFGANQAVNTSEFKKIIRLVSALKIYMDQTTGTLLIENAKLLEKIFLTWESDKPIMVHAEDETLAKALFLAKKYNRRIHCCHVSLKKEVEMIKKAKKQKIKISAEVTPHHLFLTENDQKKLGPYGNMKPPLRSHEDVNALWAGIADGMIDVLATDHAPHTIEEKEHPPAGKRPPFGVPGLETALPLMLTEVKKGTITLDKVIELYHTNPRRIFNLPKQKNTYIEVDLQNRFEIKNSNLKTKCGWSPFVNRKLYGQVKTVVLRGKRVYKDGKILANKGYGTRILI